MPTITRTVPVSVAADLAWERLADVGAVDRLMSSLDTVTVEGDRRRCSHRDGAQHEEIILSVDDDARRLAYAIVDSPLGFTHHSASMQLVRDAGGVLGVLWTTDFAPAELEETVEGMVDQAARSMEAALSA